MSLQVWLPLNENLNNQGLYNLPISPSLNNISYIDDGKLGKASSGYCIYHLNSDIVKNSWSLACWCKKTSAWSQHNDILLCENNSSPSDCHFYLSIINGGFLNIGINGSSSTASVYYKFSTNIWYHIAVTYDGTKYAMYINGELKKTGEYTAAIPTNITNLGICCRSSNEAGTSSINGGANLNDIRIYDHCLSAKEIKEISRGLIVHYRLKGLGNDNIITGYDTSFITYESGNSSIFSSQTNSGTQEIIKNMDGKSCIKIHTLGGNNRVYKTIDTSINKTYTISLDYYSSYAKDNAFKLERNGGDYVWTSSYANYTTPNEWQRLSITFTNTSDTKLYYFIYGNTDTDYYFTNIKLEEGSLSTPWVPNSESALYSKCSYNSIIEYDCSGNLNNGTKINSITCDPSSPRCGSSYKIETNKSKIQLPSINYSNFNNSYTFSWWEKIDSVTKVIPWGFSDGNHLNLYHSSGNLYWNTLDGAANPFKDDDGNVIPNTVLCNNKWHHCAITGDGKTNILYIDGEIAGTAITYKSLTGTSIYISGYNSGTTYGFVGGSLSDFRIYTTALSENDIKELYNTPISITKKGILITQGEVVE